MPETSGHHPGSPLREQQRVQEQRGSYLQGSSNRLEADLRVSGNGPSEAASREGLREATHLHPQGPRSPLEKSRMQHEATRSHQTASGLPGQPVKEREPTLEERFWQFTPDIPEGSDSDDSADEQALVNTLSLLYCLCLTFR